MKIETLDCRGCGICIPFCPVNAISMIDEKAYIDYEQCLECGTCGRSFVVHCPTEAIRESEDVYQRPRSIRKFFSDPMAYHVETRVPGRGTEEVKTNDVTGRVRKNEVGIGLEMGRPCLGTTFLDVEKVTMALADLGISFEEDNPLYHLMDDPTRGLFIDEVRQARVISAIVEFSIPRERTEEVLGRVQELAREIDTVFSLELISRFDEDGTIMALPVLEKMGFAVRPNAKINLGLGRPLRED